MSQIVQPDAFEPGLDADALPRSVELALPCFLVTSRQLEHKSVAGAQRRRPPVRKTLLQQRDRLRSKRNTMLSPCLDACSRLHPHAGLKIDVAPMRHQSLTAAAAGQEQKLNAIDRIALLIAHLVKNACEPGNLGGIKIAGPRLLTVLLDPSARVIDAQFPVGRSLKNGGERR